MAAEPERFHAQLRRKLGPDLGDELINVLAPLERNELARQADLLAYAEAALKIRGDLIEMKGQVAHLDARVDKLDAKVDKLDAKIDKLDAKVDGVAADLRAEINKLVPKFIWSGIGMATGISGLIFAAIKLA